MLHIGTWLWGDKYHRDYLFRLRRGVARWLKQPYRFHVFIPEPEDVYLTKIKGCFCRLRMFDQQWQHNCEIGEDDRLVCLDLDLIVTGPLDKLFDRPEKFVILQGANSANPCPYNGSVMMLRKGAHPEVWSDFSLDAAKKAPFYEFPDDQGWLAHKVPGAAGWKAGKDGIYAFKKPGWPKNSDDLPKDASIVVFPGWRDPQRFSNLPWVKEHWL